MAYASVHTLLQFSGTLPGGEVWSFGLRSLGDSSTTTQAELQAIADDAQAAYSTFHAVSANSMGSTVLFDLVTARIISTAGLTTLQAESSPVTPVAGAGAVAFPNQIATVVTLLTVTAGRRGRGRVYLASLGGSVASTGRMVTTKRTSLVSTFKTFADAVNVALDTAITGDALAVQSQVVPSAAAVTSIRVGDVYDTQRRRRDSMVESYASATLA